MVNTTWRKSSASTSSSGDCVEVAFAQVKAAIRDSKNPSGPMLTVPAGNWLELVKLTRQ
jgi:hypothetical protein